MKTESREFFYDKDLQLEAYQFKGIMQPFPNHFHEYYVVGFIEKGKRSLLCKNKEYELDKNDVLLFNPGDNHQCAPLDNHMLDYRALNIPKETMSSLCKNITGKKELPIFQQNVLHDSEIASHIYQVHKMIVENSDEFEKEELLLFLITTLLKHYASPFAFDTIPFHKEVEDACEYMNKHFHEHINLQKLCELTSMSSSTLLRAFTKEKGVTPYRYLEVIRINKAKELLEKGESVIDAANLAGFFDQSHFTNFFQTFIGITPGVYRSIFLKDKESTS